MYYFRSTATTPQFRTTTRLFLCLTYTSTESTLPLLLYTHSALHHSWLNTLTHAGTPQYTYLKPFLSLPLTFHRSVSPAVCTVTLKVLTFQSKSHTFLLEYTSDFIHSPTLSSRTAQTHVHFWQRHTISVCLSVDLYLLSLSFVSRSCFFLANNSSC